MESGSRHVRRGATLTRIEPVARETNVYTFELDGPLPFRAGQFVNLAVPGAAPRGERSYSIWSDPADPERLELCIKLLAGGAASEHLRSARPGLTTTVRGPFGVFLLREEPRPTWFVATGTGLAPFRSMLLDAVRRHDPRPFRLAFGVRDQQDLFALADLAGFARALPDFACTLCLSRPEPGWSGYTGRVTRLLETAELPDEAECYLCGNGAMITDARALLERRGVPRSRIRFEKFD